MRHPNYQEKTKVKVINKESVFYGMCGNVKELIAVLKDKTRIHAGYEGSEELLRKAYEDNAVEDWEVKVTFDKDKLCDYVFYACEIQPV